MHKITVQPSGSTEAKVGAAPSACNDSGGPKNLNAALLW